MIAWLKARWAWVLGAIVGAALLARAYLAGSAQGASRAFREGIIERAKTRKARATRYKAKAQATIQKAKDDAQRREQITQPNRGDWYDLKKINERLDEEDRR